MKTIEVVAAVIYDGKRIFATQRGYGEFKDGWEFPGGKVEPGETPHQALIREIREELATEISVGKLFDKVEYDYPDFHLSMRVFWAQVVNGQLELKEHEAAKWLAKDELMSVNWLPADISLVDKLRRYMDALPVDELYEGNSIELLQRVQADSVALSLCAPPYPVIRTNKNCSKEAKPAYGKAEDYAKWEDDLKQLFKEQAVVIKPGGFLAISIGDILNYPDEIMPKLQEKYINLRRVKLSEEQVQKAAMEHPDFNFQQLAKLLGCSEQTVERRLLGNSARRRGQRQYVQTRVRTVGGIIEKLAMDAGLYLYDRRIWIKDASWSNSNWNIQPNTYRSMDEFEYIYVFCKPGIIKVDRNRLTKMEWSNWGSRGIWNIPAMMGADPESVAIAEHEMGSGHEERMPVELARRLIRLLTDKDETILDCFAGSGTTAVAAIREQRHYICFEKDKAQLRRAHRNIYMYNMLANQMTLF